MRNRGVIDSASLQGGVDAGSARLGGMKCALPVIVLLFGLLAVACGGGSKTPTATAQPPTIVAPSPSGATGTPSASATSAPAATGTPSPDGTVPAGGSGSTDAVHIAANPAPGQPLQILLKDVRVGAHPEQRGWDRIVFEFASDNPQFPNALPQTDIEYVAGVAGCGSGLPIAVRGGAVLRVKFTGAQAHDDQGNVSIQGQTGNVPPRVTGPGNSIVEAVQSCDFEADVTWGAGIMSKQPFKVTTLSNPARVVIDVKWP
jgi:hypothetical protein